MSNPDHQKSILNSRMYKSGDTFSAALAGQMIHENAGVAYEAIASLCDAGKISKIDGEGGKKLYRRKVSSMNLLGMPWIVKTDDELGEDEL